MSREQNIIPILKNALITHQGLLYVKKNSFVVEVTFKPMLAFKFHFIFYFYLLKSCI